MQVGKKAHKLIWQADEQGYLTFQAMELIPKLQSSRLKRNLSRWF